jgi:hypothetical protein
MLAYNLKRVIVILASHHAIADTAFLHSLDFERTLGSSGFWHGGASVWHAYGRQKASPKTVNPLTKADPLALRLWSRDSGVGPREALRSRSGLLNRVSCRG